MFAYNLKIIDNIRRNHVDHDTAVIQDDIDSISTRCNDCRMHLNVGKFKVMHIRKKVTSSPYSIPDSMGQYQVLESTTLEKNLYTMISNDLKPRSQVHKVASKANKMLVLLKNTFVSKNPSLWKKLYMIYLRPHLEYALSTWSPYTKVDNTVQNNG